MLYVKKVKACHYLDKENKYKVVFEDNSEEILSEEQLKEKYYDVFSYLRFNGLHDFI